MAKTYQAPLLQTGKNGMAIVKTALADIDVNVDDTNLVECAEAGAEGAKLGEIRYGSMGTSVAGILKFFVYDGVKYYPLYQQDIVGVAGSTTVKTEDGIIFFSDFPLEAGNKIFAGVTVSQTDDLGIIVVFSDY